MNSSRSFTTDREELNPPLIIANPLARATAAIPIEVRLHEGQILWRRGDSSKTGPLYGFKEGESVEDAIWAFLDLVDAPDQAFVEFAERYGPLALRSDCLPATYQVRDKWVDKMPPEIAIDRDPRRWYSENVNHWRMYAIGLRAVLAFARDLAEDPDLHPGDVIDKYDLRKYTAESLDLANDVAGDPSWIWSSLLDPMEISGIVERSGPDLAQRWLAFHFSTWWIAYAGLIPVLIWEGGAPRMTLTLGAGELNSMILKLPQRMIFSVLVTQAAALITSEGIDRLDLCSVCGRLFLPTIKPGRHERSFCPEHKVEGDRERKRRWARKVAAERKAKLSS